MTIDRAETLASKGKENFDIVFLFLRFCCNFAPIIFKS